LPLIRTKAKDKNKDIENAAEEIIGTLDEAIRASRSLSADLSPPILHEKGLAAGLQWLSRQMQEKHGLLVAVQADEAAEPAAEHIRLFLFEAVRELLLNVVKYAQVNRAEVKMRMLQSKEVEITVADNGIGFDPAKLEVQSSTVGGFGLFSIKERLSYLGGRMAVDAAPGKGSRYLLIVPAQIVPPAREIKRSGTGVPAVDGQIRVLLVDDHIVLRQGLTKVLEEQPDIRVVGEAGDGEAAVNLAKQLKPDVVLMDVTLPLVDGPEATRRILSECPDIRVIGLSMHEEADIAATMFNAGAVAYLTKGGPTERLITVIRSSCFPISGS
jgi:CheY-like chemotaxis protein